MTHWIDGPAFVCYGARIAVRATKSAALKGVESRLPTPRRASCARPDWVYSIVAGGTGFSLFRGEEGLVADRSLKTVHSVLESDLHGYVAQAARRKLFVHSGAVGWRGRAVVIPARSMSGKSSLVAALVQAGAEYYSDEYAVVDVAGLVHPYPKPLSLRQSDGRPPLKRTAEELGGCTGRRPIPIGLIVATKFVDGAVWQPAPLSPADSMMELFANTVLARVRPQFALTVLTRAVAGSHAVHGERGDAAEAARAVLQLIDEIAPGR